MDNSEVLISAIMPTRGRPSLAPLAVECWRSQTHLNRELLILDDADEPSFPDGIDEPGVRYFRENVRFNIPAKLNKLCELAAGSIICRFDDDDWSAPERIETQLGRLLTSGLSLCGYHSMVFVDDSGAMRKYHGVYDYVLGTSMMFRREFWQEHRWNERKTIGSDNYFKDQARALKQIISVDAGDMMFARVHSANTSPKRMAQYHPICPGDLPQVLCR